MISSNFRCEIFESRDFLSISRYYHLAINETRFSNLEIFFILWGIEVSRFFNEIQKSRDFFFLEMHLEIFLSRILRLEIFSSRISYLEILESRLEFSISRFLNLISNFIFLEMPRYTIKWKIYNISPLFGLKIKSMDYYVLLKDDLKWHKMIYSVSCQRECFALSN